MYRGHTNYRCSCVLKKYLWLFQFLGFLIGWVYYNGALYQKILFACSIVIFLLELILLNAFSYSDRHFRVVLRVDAKSNDVQQDKIKQKNNRSQAASVERSTSVILFLQMLPEHPDFMDVHSLFLGVGESKWFNVRWEIFQMTYEAAFHRRCMYME